jgi:hypothetical protein
MWSFSTSLRNQVSAAVITMRFDSHTESAACLVTIHISISGEYVRRVGRTGRAGRRGTVTVLVHGRQVPIAKQVLGASIEGKKIEPVPELSNLESWRRSGDNE